MLLRAIGSDAHILDVLPTMWPPALALFKQAVASPAAVIKGTLEHFIEGAARGEAHCADLLVWRLLSAAFTAKASATRNHAAKFFPAGGICAADSITAEDRERLSGMLITSTASSLLGARSMSELGQAAVTFAQASSLATPTAPRPRCASAQAARRSKSSAQEGAAGSQGEHAAEAHSSWLGAAGDAPGQALREARKARCESNRARAHRRAAACRALLRCEADVCGGHAELG
eukprot:3980441-Pleurochrysis_carterae.AAC.1